LRAVAREARKAGGWLVEGLSLECVFMLLDIDASDG
jgi:hypothetical protein